jgi:hypothetical protein
LFPEFQGCGTDSSSSLGGVPPPSVISMGIEVADIWYDRISVRKICHIIPPFIKPILMLRVCSASYELLL